MPRDDSDPSEVADVIFPGSGESPATTDEASSEGAQAKKEESIDLN